MARFPEPTTAAAVASACGGRLVGDAGAVVEGARSLESAGPADLAFAADAKAEKAAAASAVGVLLARSALGFPGRTVVEVPDPAAALASVLEAFLPRRAPSPGIHPTAIVEAGARVAADVSVGPYAVVGGETEIGPGAILEAHVVVGRRCRVGAGARLHPHVVLYDDVSIGPGTEIHAGAVLGADGFGYVASQTGLKKVPQVGGVEVGSGVEIGANTCIDRATLEATRVGDGTKIDDLVMVGHNCEVGAHVVLCGQVGLAGSTTVGDQTVLAGQVGTGGHLRIGRGVKAGGQTGIVSDVPDGASLFGTPHLPHRDAFRVHAEMKKLPETARLVRELARAGGEKR
ncbi:MAG TPA: UDP-3-O-(3-hydroxymyristoyl)glucosamine N-acyltransferase [Thermoanaerobaculia bacterium]|nr:UDP-3-O-(3-hydroxymyristoyl)glucosamine N-acyltransferase [Thermoanaerobaculia bacterium]